MQKIKKKNKKLLTVKKQTHLFEDSEKPSNSLENSETDKNNKNKIEK